MNVDCRTISRANEGNGKKNKETNWVLNKKEKTMKIEIIVMLKK